jgi:peptidyl-prolyl cis-trans isomerase C
MQKNRLGAAVAALVFAAFTSVAANAAPAKKKEKAAAPAVPAYATVNGVKISKSLADAFLKEQLAQGIPNSPELQKMVREELIRREVVAQAAKAQGLDKSPDIAAQIELSKQALLIRAYVKNYIENNPTTDEAVRAEYDKVRPQMVDKEYKSRHVLVESEAEATAIIAKLDAGEKIETLASQSKDPGSKDNGGDLGWSAATAYVKPFADALASLEKGKYTKQPVKTEFGFHVIQLEETRTAEPPPFEHVKGQLAQHLQQQKIEKLISDLQAKAKVE